MDSFLKVLEISKWPFVTLVFGTIFLFLFKSPISDFIRRIKKAGKEGITTDTSPEVQKEDSNKPIEELMDRSDTGYVKELEESIIKDLSDRELVPKDDTSKYLVNQLAVTIIALDFEQIYNMIFASQITLLKKLNEVLGYGKPLEFISDYFLNVKNAFLELEEWDVNIFLNFLFRNGLIHKENEIYQISTKGREFLFWLIRNGKSEERPI